MFVYKQGGDWEKDGIKYTIDYINPVFLNEYLFDGWVSNFDELKDASGDDYESELREKIKALNGKPGGRSSIATLEKQLKELQGDN